MDLAPHPRINTAPSTPTSRRRQVDPCCATDELLRGIRVAALRFGLATRAGDIPVPLLRGTFGAALHAISLDAYTEVFRPDADESAPAYLLRRSPHQLEREPVFEILLFERAFRHADAMQNALCLAGVRGVGRERLPFRIAHRTWLEPSGRPLDDSGAIVRPFALDTAPWPLAGDPAQTPCRLFFPEPLRILQRHRLIQRPGPRDLVVAGCRRLAGLVPPAQRLGCHDLQRVLLAASDGVTAQPFIGDSAVVRRWSASQEQHIDLRGVRGHLDFPEGPGPLWRLLTALLWVHCGKGTVLGMGRPVVTPIW